MGAESAPIYLDHAATTPVDPRVIRRMADVLALPLGNAAAVHAPGRAAHELVEASRAQVAALIGAAAEDIVFTSGATESNNLAITGTARLALQRGAKPHIVTLATEHKSVLEPVRALQAQGVPVSILRPGHDGLLDPEVLSAALRPDTALVSLLHVNNETGVAQDVAALSAVCRARGVPLHLDCCQSAGKLPVAANDVALLSCTAHKLGGPQGIGALYVSPAHRGRLAPQMLGGGHERGLRAGTLAVHQIAGFGLAAELAASRRAAESQRLAALRDRLWAGLSRLPGVLRNGHATARAPHILNVSFEGIEGESLFAALPELVLSTGSACNSRSAEPSFVLRALGRDTELAQGSLRFSLGHDTTEAHIDAALDAVRRAHAVLSGLSPARPLPLAGWSGNDGTQLWVGEGGAQRLGAWVRIAARVEGGQIREARCQVYGCPHTQAACRLVCGQLLGLAPGISPGTPQHWLQAVNGPVEKLGRMLIIEDAIRALQSTPWPSR
ncbi:MAG: cysteine desulfurase family protein [Steroidobacteraceae bacterium]